MSNYPKIGIRPVIDGRQGGVRESLEEKTMNLAKIVSELISNNLKNGDGTPVECVIADGTIGRVGESAACAEKFERAGVGATITHLLLVLRYRDYGHASTSPESGVGIQWYRAARCGIPCSGIGCTRAEGTSRFRYLRP